MAITFNGVAVTGGGGGVRGGRKVGFPLGTGFHCTGKSFFFYFTCVANIINRRMYNIQKSLM